ncbi:hypothetical protein LR68_03853 [Anoxybacillus sp. BCO1]|nr:hypothetical protein LR68_03853 [Anoxybacillus sp. BCO1]
MAVQKRRNDTGYLFKEIAQVVAPPPELTVSEWLIYTDVYHRSHRLNLDNGERIERPINARLWMQSTTQLLRRL